MSSALEALKKSKSNFDVLTKKLENTIEQPEKKNKYKTIGYGNLNLISLAMVTL